jgi:hypothetical protein
MFDLIFYEDIIFCSNLKNDAVRLGNEILKRTTKYICNNNNICMDLTYHQLLASNYTKFSRDIFTYCNEYDDYFNR